MRSFEMIQKRLGWFLALSVLVFAFGVLVFRPVAAAPQAGNAAATGGRFTVVDSEGTNLEVVDNTTNTLYFYTVEPGKEVGDDLHLRGALDLNEVGKPVLKPRKADK
jgi:hypothetical protein